MHASTPILAVLLLAADVAVILSADVAGILAMDVAAIAVILAGFSLFSPRRLVLE